MKLIKPFYKIISNINSKYLLSLIEYAGRTCYKIDEIKEIFWR